MVGCPASRPHSWAAESGKGVPSEWPSRIWPRGLSSPCHLGPRLFPSGTLTGMSWRLQRAAASSNPLQSPCPPPLQETMHIPWSLAHLADTQAGRAEAPWTPNARRRGQEGTGSRPRVGKGGMRAVSGVQGGIHHPFHALSLCSLQPKAMFLTHSCLSPCFPNARDKSSCCYPLPQSRQVKWPGS